MGVGHFVLLAWLVCTGSCGEPLGIVVLDGDMC